MNNLQTYQKLTSQVLDIASRVHIMRGGNKDLKLADVDVNRIYVTSTPSIGEDFLRVIVEWETYDGDITYPNNVQFNCTYMDNPDWQKVELEVLRGLKKERDDGIAKQKAKDDIRIKNHELVELDHIRKRKIELEKKYPNA